MGRVSSGLLLTLVLALLVVPLCFYAGPPVLAALDREQPRRQLVVPAYQQAPAVLSAGRDDFPAPADPGAPLPDTKVLGGLLDAELAVPGSGQFHGTVVDVLTGEILYDLNGAAPATPASSLKLLTAAAALSVLGSDTRFETSVYAGGTPETVVLAGGGDVLLGTGASDENAVVGHAGLQTLAEETAAALSGRGVSGTVSVQLDDSLFTGDVLSPAWNREDIQAGEAAALYPLAVNSAWAVEGRQYGARVDDAALAAADAFTAALKTAAAGYGFEVDARVTRGTAGDGADRLATVASAPVAEQVTQMLLASDNYLAEALGRMAALKTGREGSFDGAAAAVEAAVSGLGVNTAGMVLADVSGLGSGTEISALQLASAVRAALTSPDSSVRDLPYALPVAGLSGTLASRFAGDTPAAGLVRAKTGTLFAVTSLTGFVTDADGRLLSFAIVANGLENNTAQARAAVDAAAAVLAGCGCR